MGPGPPYPERVTGCADLADSINRLVRFCARRDVPALTCEAVAAAAGGVADVAILFGGSVLAGADVFAAGMRQADRSGQLRLRATPWTSTAH